MTSSRKSFGLPSGPAGLPLTGELPMPDHAQAEVSAAKPDPVMGQGGPPEGERGEGGRRVIGSASALMTFQVPMPASADGGRAVVAASVTWSVAQPVKI